MHSIRTDVSFGTSRTVREQSWFLVDYHRSLDGHHPIAFEEAYEVEIVAGNADKFNIDPTRLAIAGDGIGGNMVGPEQGRTAGAGGRGFGVSARRRCAAAASAAGPACQLRTPAPPAKSKPPTEAEGAR